MLPRRCLPLLIATALALLPVARASAVGFDFVVLASSLRAVVPAIEIPPSIDDTGEVAFAGSAAGSQWVLVADEPGAEVLADYLVIDGDPALSFNPLSGNVLGSFTDGWVAYRTQDFLTPGPQYVARGDGGSVEVLYSGDDPAPVAPAVNADGQYVLHRQSPTRIVVVEDQVETVLFQYFQTLDDGSRLVGNFRPMPDIDDVGRVAFAATAAVDGQEICSNRIFLSNLLSPGAPAVVAAGGAREGCPFLSSGLTVPLAANDVGSVAFAGTFLDPVSLDSKRAVYLDGVSVWDELMPGFPAALGVDAVALNDAGTVAFSLNTAQGTHLYVGSDPVADEVLSAGDALCDDTVTEIYFHRYGLNDAGELALGVALSDGRRLIVRAEPSTGPGGECIRFPVPEPGGAAAAALAALAVLAATTVPRRSGTPCP